MPLLLGIDTGGTYTDAVILRESADPPVIASAKALTTHDALDEGIAEAIGTVLTSSGVGGNDIALVSISTTLATNALVEGKGSRVALVFAGFDPADSGRAGLMQALDGDPLILIGGGHDSGGREVQPPDLAALDTQLATLPSHVAAFAVVSRFAARTPAHEHAIRDHLIARTGLPVTCGHELSARLNGPLRAVTAVLNARLIGLISDLIAAVEASMTRASIDAPLMLVRGDGAMVAASFAKSRPIETILSGPAASLVGAAALTGEADAVIADIGGTTTDIAVLRGGTPRLNADGAEVGGHRTMVEAVDMRAIGLGGDSAVSIDDSGLTPRLTLGPRRSVPISLLAHLCPDQVLAELRAQRDAERPPPHAVSFARLVPGRESQTADRSTAEVLTRLADGPVAVARLADNRRWLSALRRLAQAGHVRMAGFTPSDAAHVLGLHEAWSGEAADLAADILAARRDGKGARLAPTRQAFSQMVIDRLVRQSAGAVLGAALAEDGISLPDPLADPLVRVGDRSDRPFAARIDIGLALPLIGLGASAKIYYPHVALRLGTRAVLPELAPVANAIGAVSGRVSVRCQATIVQQADGAFKVHDSALPHPFPSLDTALAAARDTLGPRAEADARAAGTDQPTTSIRIDRRTATIEGQETLVEAVVTASASGRPRLVQDIGV